MPIKSHVIPPAAISTPELLSVIAESSFETLTFGLGIGGTITSGAKLPPLLPMTEDLIPVYLALLCKTWPTSGNLVFDILFRPFGSTTRKTISDGASFTVGINSDTLVLTNFASNLILTELGELSADVISAGGASDVTVRMKCKRSKPVPQAVQAAVIPISVLPAGPGFKKIGTLEFSNPQSSSGIALIG